MADLIIESLRGGMNDSDPPTKVGEDQCVLARNVEFNDSLLGERRRGSITIDVAGSGLVGHTRVPFIFRHLPNTDETAAELWALGYTPSSSATLVYKDTSWHTVVPVDAFTLGVDEIYEITAQSFRGKMFIAYKSGVDRLHVWDGTTLRKAGLAAVAGAPTGADSGVGTFIGTRYYRVRFTVQTGGSTVLRSEPSAVLTFAPSGTGTGVTVTKPVAPSEGETHWELEASISLNGDYYRVATTIMATATAVDTTDYVSGYPSAGFTLSEDSGDYTVIPSVRFLVVDQDRLVYGGNHEDPEMDSRVGWTPVYNDPGSGNDERAPIDTDSFNDLDGLDGGGLTNMAAPVNGYIFVTKISAIYKMIRTNLRTHAYDVTCLTKERGALPGSLVAGVDQAGNPCLYGLDLKVGPIRIGRNGIQTASEDILETWQTVNIDATTAVCRAVFYPDTRQVHWWVAGPGENAPSFRIMLQTNQTRDAEDGVRRGWTVHTLPTDKHVYSVCMFAENIDDDTLRSSTLRPFIGTDDTSGLIQQCDTGTTDNGTAYTARIVTRPIIAAGILNKFNVANAALLATADPDAEIRISATALGDYGAELLTPIDVSLAATTTEDQVIKTLDNFSLSQIRMLQIEFTDVTNPEGIWELNQFAMRPTKGQGA